MSIRFLCYLQLQTMDRFYKYACSRGFSEASVTEWSKVLRSGRSVFARVGSSPTACIFAFFIFGVFILYLFFYVYLLALLI